MGRQGKVHRLADRSGGFSWCRPSGGGMSAGTVERPATIPGEIRSDFRSFAISARYNATSLERLNDHE